MSFDLIAMICRLGMAAWECQPQTAIHVYPLGPCANELVCQREAQMRMADPEIGGWHVKDDEYIKYAVVRRG